MLSRINLIWQSVVSTIDHVNDHFTSYRLVLYSLCAFLGLGVVGSLTGQISYTWYHLLISAGWIVAVCWITNKLLSRFLNIPSNKESDLISGLILALIMAPPISASDYGVLAIAAAAAMASKYILAVRRSHIFNPAAFGAVIAGVIFNDYPSWWIGTKFTAPLIVIAAILILRKIKRFSLVLTFSAIYVLLLIWTMPSGSSTDAVQHLVWLGITSTSLLFFSTIMLTEPLTSPARLNPTLIYAAIVGIFYSYNKLHVSPEESLLIGNAFAFLFVPNRRYQLSFIHKLKDADGIFSYVFEAPEKFHFKAGQYMEWTLNSRETDSRGNRRYFTISSSPTEQELALTVKLPPKPSIFKQKLDQLKPGDTILASYLSGSFSLPDDKNKKLALLAGGVGITPFRSMIVDLIDRGESRDIALLYSTGKPEEIAFRDVFSAAKAIGLKSSYLNSIDQQVITQTLPDYKVRNFYISGPYGFVQAMEKNLLTLGVSPAQIVTDYFPGYGS